MIRYLATTIAFAIAVGLIVASTRAWSAQIRNPSFESFGNDGVPGNSDLQPPDDWYQNQPVGSPDTVT